MKTSADIFPTLTKLTGFKTPAPKPAVFDLTPTWEALMPALIAAAANGSQNAVAELTHLARTVDRHNQRSKENLAAHKAVSARNRGAK